MLREAIAKARILHEQKIPPVRIHIVGEGWYEATRPDFMILLADPAKTLKDYIHEAVDKGDMHPCEAPPRIEFDGMDDPGTMITEMALGFFNGYPECCVLEWGMTCPVLNSVDTHNLSDDVGYRPCEACYEKMQVNP
jgi:hypothetical protein